MILFKEKMVLDNWIGAAIGALGTIGSAALNTFGKSGGGSVQPELSNRQWAQQVAMYRYQNRSLIPHLVSGAKRAGIHPLAALGVNPAQANMSWNVGGSSGGGRDYSGLAAVGQDIGRAVDAYSSRNELAADQARLRESADLDLQRKRKENEILDVELMSKTRDLRNPAGNPPGISSLPDHAQAIPGQGDVVNIKPDEVTVHNNGHTAGVHALMNYRLGPPDNDGRIPIYSTIDQNAGDAMDADFASKARYNVREFVDLMKSWAGEQIKKRPNIEKPGYHLEWNRGYGYWMFVPNVRSGSSKHSRTVYNTDGDHLRVIEHYKINP